MSGTIHTVHAGTRDITKFYYFHFRFSAEVKAGSEECVCGAVERGKSSILPSSYPPFLISSLPGCFSYFLPSSYSLPPILSYWLTFILPSYFCYPLPNINHSWLLFFLPPWLPIPPLYLFILHFPIFYLPGSHFALVSFFPA